MTPPGSPQASADALESAVGAALRAFARIDEATSQIPLRPGGWCARETLGHLVDSACNNHRRFVVGQPPGVERFDGYAQEVWVARSRYRDAPWDGLVTLWAAYNRHLVRLMRATNPEAGAATALAPGGTGQVSVAFLMDDYVRHLRHHVGQIRAFAEAQGQRRSLGDPVAGDDARRPDRAPLAGAGHDLEPIDPDCHLDDLFTGTDTPAAEGMWTYLWYGPFAGRHEMRVWLRSCAASADPLFFAVVEKASRRAVGMCSLMRIAPDMRTIEIGHVWYAPHVQGTGVNADVALTLLTACFERWGYRRVEWKCDALNARSRAAALTLGFTFEGISRQHMVRRGRSRDTAWFALLDAEWPAARAALVSRLQPPA